MNRRADSGSYLVTGLIMVAVFMSIALTVATYTSIRYNLVVRKSYSDQALAAARSGLDVALSQLNDDEYHYKHCYCMGIETTLGNTGSTGNRVSYTIMNAAPTLGSDRQSTDYWITVRGRVYRGNSVYLEKSIKALVSDKNPDGTTNSLFDYAVQTGYGELNSGGTAGRVNGPKIRGLGNARAYTTSTANGHITADEMWMYDFTCPTTGGSTFPRRCGPSEKIAVVGEGCLSGNCGDITVPALHVPATYSTNVSGRILGVNSGLGDAINPPDFPQIDRNLIKNRVVNTITGNVACTSGTLYVGTKPGETTKVTGDLLLGNGGTCTIYLRGDVWVLGSLRVGNNSTFYTADTDTSGNPILSAPIVMVDGCCNGTASINITNNGTNILENSYGIGKILATYYCSAPVSCEGNLTGDNLFGQLSQDWISVEPGSGNAQTHRDLALYSRWGRVHVIRDNTCFCSVIGQSYLGNGSNPVISYTTPDAVNLGGRQGKIFKIISYTEAEIVTSANTSSIGSIGTPQTGASNTIVNGQDGLPIVAYTTGNDGDKRTYIALCSDFNCASSTTVSFDSGSANSARWSDKGLAIGIDGKPILAWSNDNGLRVTWCVSADCTTRQTTQIINSAGASDPSMAIGADGKPVIAYHNSNGNLAIFVCNDSPCTGGTARNIDTTASSGQSPSIAIGTDMFPIVTENVSGSCCNRTFKVVHCGSVDCSSGNNIYTFGTNTNGGSTFTQSIAIGSDGFPVMTYTDGSSYGVRKCTTITCSTSSFSPVGTYQAASFTNTNLKLGPNGYPMFTINNAPNTLIVSCGNPTCGSGNTTVTLDTNGPSPQSSFVYGVDGLPIVTYIQSGSIKTIKCATFTCS